jgi:hypothetical protein
MFVGLSIILMNYALLFFLRTTFAFPLSLTWRRDSAVGIATGYWLDDRAIGVRVPEG